MRRAALYRYQLPLCQPLPLAGGWLQQRQGLLLTLQDGLQCGYGEAAPLPGFSKESLADAEVAAIAALRLWLADERATSAQLPASVQAAMAAASAGLRQPTAPDTTIVPLPPHAALFSRLDQQAVSRWRQWSGKRPSHLKIKLPGANLQQHDLLAALLAIAPVRLRLDANRQWPLAGAARWWQQLPNVVREAIDYVEEPLADSQQLPLLHQQCGLPYAWDESLCHHWQAHSLPANRPAGLAALVVKPMVVGGEDAVATLARIAADWQLKLVLSSALESSVGLREVARLATLYSPTQAAGLDTWQAFSQDLLQPLAQGRPALALNQLQRCWSGP